MLKFSVSSIDCIISFISSIEVSNIFFCSSISFFVLCIFSFIIENIFSFKSCIFVFFISFIILNNKTIFFSSKVFFNSSFTFSSPIFSILSNVNNTFSIFFF